jgi:alpha-mannosidase
MMTENEINTVKQRTGLFLERAAAQILREFVPMDAQYAKTREHVRFTERPQGRYRPIREGAVWGKVWDTAWFRLTGKIPAAWRGRVVVADLDLNGEGLVFDGDGRVLQGITNGSVFDHAHARSIVRLADCARGGEKLELWVEAACNGLFGANLPKDPPRDDPGRHGSYAGQAHRMRLCVMDEDLRALCLDMTLLRGLLNVLPPRSTRFDRVARALHFAMDSFADDPSHAARSRERLHPVLACPAHASALRVTAVGHAHIDTGWLWPVRETVRKSARTFATQLRLLERYPDYVFGASQPQHYAFVKERYPELYREIGKAVRAGRWECQGGMWVEADCNIPGGEALVRQFLHGKNFFMDEFGVDVRNLWVPDVFGYSPALPQIIRKAGCQSFVTQKLSWSQINVFPHTTFRWRGIDGTEIVTHFPPEGTYNSALQPEMLARGEERFRERAFLEGHLSLFGVGDGGGGPTEEHIETGLRQANLEGASRVSFGPAQAFLDRMVERADELAVWNGELYLELHRGTLTTQARTKRGNRMLENRLRQTEWLCAGLPSADYPQSALDGVWKTLLINQFHDILPGSSIRAVYRQTEEEHRQALRQCDRLLQEAGRQLFRRDRQAVTLVNVLSCDCVRPVELPDDWGEAGAVDEAGVALPVQIEEGRAVVFAQVPAGGVLTLRRAGKASATKKGGGLTLENGLVRAEFSRDGELLRMLDKEVGREVLAAGAKGNVLSLYEDRPNHWDAWDIDAEYMRQRLETARGTQAERLPGGPVRQGLRFSLRIGQSVVEQSVFLAANSKRIEFATRVDWRERHRMLRVSFPVSVLADSFASDIQFGYVMRPTHANTSWDKAKFETAAHRYVDLSERDYGVALLNDCKYGHKVCGQTLDLNLLRSSTHPDAEADQGEQVFTYALLPHCGDLIASAVMDEAACLNVLPMRFDRLAATRNPAPCRIEGEGVSLESLKKAEKDDRLILRLVETQGRRSTCRLTLPAGATLSETNLMEWSDDGEIACDGAVELIFAPFEIRTFRLRRK